MWVQKEISISAKKRGFYLITDEINANLPEIKSFNIGIIHLFIKHTSASLTLNENQDPTVREDMESHFNVLVPENADYYHHVYEGADDMPAHIKSTIVGASVSIPIANGCLNLGEWQGIYLCEHRNFGSARTIIATINGERAR